MEDNWVRARSFFGAVRTLRGSKGKVDLLNEECIRLVKEQGAPLITLLHGIGANYYFSMYSLIEKFWERGIPVVSLKYDYKDHPKYSTQQVKTQIDDLMEKTGVKKIDMIGFSLGGVIARYYAEILGQANNIDRLVTVHSPVKPIDTGTIGYYLPYLLFANPKDLNEVVTSMRGQYSVKNHLAIYGKRDFVVGDQAPETDKIKSIQINQGHLFITYNPTVFNIAVDYINGNFPNKDALEE